MLYEMVTGQLPFRGDYEHAVVYALLIRPVQPMSALRPAVPVELDHIVAGAMAKDPSERYRSAEEVLRRC